MVGTKNDPRKYARRLLEKNREALRDLGFETSAQLDVLTYTVLASLSELLIFILSTGNTKVYFQILAEYGNLLKERAPQMVVRVKTAVPLTPDELKELKASLKGILRGDFRLDVRVDSNITGGLVIEVADRVIDQSLQSRLNELKERLGSRD